MEVLERTRLIEITLLPLCEQDLRSPGAYLDGARAPEQLAREMGLYKPSRAKLE